MCMHIAGIYTDVNSLDCRYQVCYKVYTPYSTTTCPFSFRWMGKLCHQVRGWLTEARLCHEPCVIPRSSASRVNSNERSRFCVQHADRCASSVGMRRAHLGIRLSIKSTSAALSSSSIVSKGSSLLLRRRCHRLSFLMSSARVPKNVFLASRTTERFDDWKLSV
jgi:hypothetical protein